MLGVLNRILLVVSMVLMLSVPQLSLAQTEVVVQEKPSALAMTGDLVVVRPMMLVMTGLGLGLFIVSTPFSLAGGNWKQSAKTLVAKPAYTTFVRCLGCKKPGYQTDVEEVDGAEK